MADEASQAAEPTAVDSDRAVEAGGRPTMAVKVYAPFKVYFEGDAYSVSAVNATGPFDILPRHHNFLCMLVPCVLEIDSPAGPKAIKVSRALMHVEANRTVVFMDV